jgi:putative transposase
MGDKPRLMPVAEPADRSPYHGYRFPSEIIAHAVWLYFRFHLSFRDVQDLLAERGLIVSHETVRQWCTKYGATFAAGLRRRRVRAGDKWHLDEVLLKINGKRHWLWRAVDQHGVVLDILVQERRDQAAAERFLHRVLEGEGGAEPRVVITDKLASYPPAIKRVLPIAEHRRHKRLNNRAENSHLPTRRRERVLQRFKSAEHAQRFLGPFSAVSNHFRPRRHRLTASAYRQIRTHAHIAWQDVTRAGLWQ